MYDLNKMKERIKSLKKQLNLTNLELAERSDIPVGTLNKMLGTETKDPQISTIIKIAKALNISADYLILGDTPNEQKNKVELSESESFLLNTFRNLSEQGQEYILQTIDMVKDKYKKDIYFTHNEEVS